MRSEFIAVCGGVSSSCLHPRGVQHSDFLSSSKLRASQLVFAPERAGRESRCKVHARFRSCRGGVLRTIGRVTNPRSLIGKALHSSDWALNLAAQLLRPNPHLLKKLDSVTSSHSS